MAANGHWVSQQLNRVVFCWVDCMMVFGPVKTRSVRVIFAHSCCNTSAALRYFNQKQDMLKFWHPGDKSEMKGEQYSIRVHRETETFEMGSGQKKNVVRMVTVGLFYYLIERMLILPLAYVKFQPQTQKRLFFVFFQSLYSSLWRWMWRLEW